MNNNELLFWKIFRNNFLFYKIFSNFNNLVSNYDRIFNVIDILKKFKNGVEILKDKVKSKKYLLINSTSTFEINNGLLPICRTIYKANEENRLFYQQLFKNYPNDFLYPDIVFPFIIQSFSIFALEQFIQYFQFDNFKIQEIYNREIKIYKIHNYKSLKMFDYLKSNFNLPKAIPTTYISKPNIVPKTFGNPSICCGIDPKYDLDDEKEQYSYDDDKSYNSYYHFGQSLILRYFYIFGESTKFKQFIKICKIINKHQLYCGFNSIHFNLKELQSLEDQFTKEQLEKGIIPLLKELNNNFSLGYYNNKQSIATKENEMKRNLIFKTIKTYYSNISLETRLPYQYFFLFCNTESELRTKIKAKRGYIDEYQGDFIERFSRKEEIFQYVSEQFEFYNNSFDENHIYNRVPYINSRDEFLDYLLCKIIYMDDMEIIEPIFNKNYEAIIELHLDRGSIYSSIRSIKFLNYLYNNEHYRIHFYNKNLCWNQFQNLELFENFESKIKSLNKTLTLSYNFVNYTPIAASALKKSLQYSKDNPSSILLPDEQDETKPQPLYYFYQDHTDYEGYDPLDSLILSKYHNIFKKLIIHNKTKEIIEIIELIQEDYLDFNLIFNHNYDTQIYFEIGQWILSNMINDETEIKIIQNNNYKDYVINVKINIINNNKNIKIKKTCNMKLYQFVRLSLITGMLDKISNLKISKESKDDFVENHCGNIFTDLSNYCNTNLIDYFIQFFENEYIILKKLLHESISKSNLQIFQYLFSKYSDHIKTNNNLLYLILNWSINSSNIPMIEIIIQSNFENFKKNSFKESIQNSKSKIIKKYLETKIENKL